MGSDRTARRCALGGLERVLWDRPFLVVDWDAEREEALGVGLVIEGALGSVFY